MRIQRYFAGYRNAGDLDSRAHNGIEQQLADAHRQDMVDLLNSMPQWTGSNRSNAAYDRVEFNGLSTVDQARAREYAVQEFPRMDDLAQHMLSGTSRPPVRDMRPLPTLRRLLDRTERIRTRLQPTWTLLRRRLSVRRSRSACA